MKDPQFFGWGRGSPCASPRKQKAACGLQLLSPSVQQEQMVESRRTVVVEAPPSSCSSTASLSRSMSSLSTKKQVAFDFDAFTIASVRQRQEQQQPVDEPETTPPAPVRSSSHSSAAQQQAAYNEVDTLRDQFEHNGFFDTNSFYTMRSTDDFEHLRKQHSSSLSATSSVHNLNMSTMTERTNSSGRPTTISHQPVAATAAVHSGWLQKRKGLVIKRWKAQYCVLKADAKLCLYASEDVVNGKLEQRFQLLRVSLSEKSDAFQIIGVGRDGGPCKEEFRAAHSVDWQAWFCAFRDYFDSDALHAVLQRKPELSLLSPANSRSWRHDDSGITHEVEQMILGSRRVVRNGSIPHPYAGSPRSDCQSISSRKLSSRRESTDNPAFDDSNSSRSTLSSISGASSNRVSIFQAPDKATEEETLAEPVPAEEWPMIQRDSQYPVPILEGRGSESQSTAPSDACDNSAVVKASVFSW